MIRVQGEDFDIGSELASLTGQRPGAVVSFLGLVRDFSQEGEPTTTLTLEHYPGMTERKLADIEAKARRRWPLKEVLVVHRYGRLDPGDRIVLVAVTAAHRQVAFEACQFLVDCLKTDAPFWKCEESDSDTRWVGARASDASAAERWLKK